ncbi:methyltransferase [Solwaraspora sp. WMMD791]|uniref:methyltransferase n=1 Tax=Solwaraspora sp. WMMD791 TaxID=3016086 RepID=UPI00249C8CD1|nr:methyltransferase [Solwaraspora sp. WMMD791]WFE30318.1 methyltransferase [Solwaraspora sp. WMMD791]
MTELAPFQQLLTMTDLLVPAAVRAAATLGIADHIAGGATTPDEIARRAGSVPDVTATLLRYLAEIGLLDRDDDDTYALTPLAEPLRTDHPQSVRTMLRNDGMIGGSTLALLRLDHTVRTGRPGYAAEYGRDYWEAVNHDPAFDAEWQEQAAAADRAAGQALAWDAGTVVTGYDWSTVDSFVDVGGHLGSLTLALVRAHPHLRGTLVDLRNVSTQAGRRFARSEVADRLRAIEGSFFDPLPAGHDVYLLSAILADWSDDEAVLILKRCREAAGDRGAVLVADIAMPISGPGAELQLRSMMPAPARSAAQIEELAAAAGLRLSWRGPGTAVRTLLEFTTA